MQVHACQLHFIVIVIIIIIVIFNIIVIVIVIVILYFWLQGQNVKLKTENLVLKSKFNSKTKMEPTTGSLSPPYSNPSNSPQRQVHGHYFTKTNHLRMSFSHFHHHYDDPDDNANH